MFCKNGVERLSGGRSGLWDILFSNNRNVLSPMGVWIEPYPEVVSGNEPRILNQVEIHFGTERYRSMT